MSRIRYREPSIDRHCGSEPGDIADALRGRGEAMAEMLMARRVWHRRWITTDPEAWAAAVLVAGAS